ncbi:hypothetical protein [Sinanaerobacter sp. ZZT-01]|uniref:hypothetical protein n=1 Tax=Sinanaerobacter sp. ZZT-01 TaxID=3111540 RepID=UPI002D793476|nr:hypothetical protein [Sinanaerobacter sp. ZZT-01]WRR93366.1 hypothetical protein U5921_15255 [Sinanaerobacter sp. ZZT-01]
MEYEIIPEDGQYALYRKLEENEEVYYLKELERLKKRENNIWLHLKSGEEAQLQKELQKLESGCCHSKNWVK